MDGVGSATGSHAASVTVGHLTLSEEGDVLVAHLRGDLGPAEEGVFQQWRDRVTARHGYRLILAVSEGSLSVTPEARKMIVHWSRLQTRPGSTAFVGASFAMQTVVNFVVRAIRALTSNRVTFAFFSSETEARAWLAEERKRYRSASA